MSISAGGGSSESKTKDLTPKEYKKQRGFISSELRSRIAGDVPQITGPFVAPLSAGEAAGLNAFQQNAFGAGGLGAAADKQIAATLGDPNANPFLQAMYEAAIRPLLENAQLQELRDRAQFTGTGQKIQGSSAFAEDRMRSVRDTERTIADVGVQLAYQERQNQLQAVNLANARLQEQREGIATLALPRLIEQFGIDKANAELQRRYQIMDEALQQLAALTTPTLGTFSTSAYGNASISAGTAAPQVASGMGIG